MIFGSKTDGFYRDEKIACHHFDRKRQYVRVKWICKSLEMWYGRNKHKRKIISKVFTNFKILSLSPLLVKTTGTSPVLGLSHHNLSLWYRNWVERTSHKGIWSPRASPLGWGFSKAWVDQQKQSPGSERSICQLCEQKFIPFLIDNVKKVLMKRIWVPWAN